MGNHIDKKSHIFSQSLPIIEYSRIYGSELSSPLPPPPPPPPSPKLSKLSAPEANWPSIEDLEIASQKLLDLFGPGNVIYKNDYNTEEEKETEKL